jgi:hypothetical protein
MQPHLISGVRGNRTQGKPMDSATMEKTEPRRLTQMLFFSHGEILVR